MTRHQSGTLCVTVGAMQSIAILTPHGVLDSRTYRSLRDRIIKAALDEPTAVVVDVTDLAVPAESALVVFTSARWHVSTWPEVPIVLVCEHIAGRSALSRNGVTRYVPVYPTMRDAVEAVSHARPQRLRHRARADLPHQPTTLARARELVSEWLTAWSQTELIPTAKIVVTTFVENVLQHTDSRLSVRVETDGTMVTVAVQDGSTAPVNIREAQSETEAPSGLQIVGALCRAWGNAPTPTGKTVWAVIGPENQL